MDRKLFAGSRVRRLRRERALTLTEMAGHLNISTSYLHLIERDQRPISAQLLLRLAEVYDLDPRDLAGVEDAQTTVALREVFSDPFFRDRPVSNNELADAVAASPALAQALVRLYRAYREQAVNAAEMVDRLTDRDHRAGGDGGHFPIEDVRDFLHAENNHFPGLEAAAESLLARTVSVLTVDNDLATKLRRYLRDAHGVIVEILPAGRMDGGARCYDGSQRRLLLSEMLHRSARIFAIAYQIGLLEFRPAIDEVVGRSMLHSEESRRLLCIALANYFAGAVMMPYEQFLGSAEQLRYDIDILAHRFDASFEQVCHRLTTLQRPGMRGVPFFMLRLDHAGNISKRFSAGGFPFARLGGTCPRWNVHEAFRFPGRIVTQMVQLPDATAYFSLARTVDAWSGGYRQGRPQLAIGLGCAVSHARRLIYADDYDLETLRQAVAIGINCRLCERTDCNQRAMPPFNASLMVDEQQRGPTPFRFAIDR
jgi:predicted transcriptional regulator/transcriptional regulator with XRE-family HTH domain